MKIKSVKSAQTIDAAGVKAVFGCGGVPQGLPLDGFVDEMIAQIVACNGVTREEAVNLINLHTKA